MISRQFQPVHEAVQCALSDQLGLALYRREDTLLGVYGADAWGGASQERVKLQFELDRAREQVAPIPSPPSHYHHTPPPTTPHLTLPSPPFFPFSLPKVICGLQPTTWSNHKFAMKYAFVLIH